MSPEEREASAESATLSCPNTECELFEVPYEVNTALSTFCGTCGTRIGLGTEDQDGNSGVVAFDFTLEELGAADAEADAAAEAAAAATN